MKSWVKMPSYWVREESSPPLTQLRWSGDQKADQIAALMIYIVLAHHANDSPTAEFPEPGYCRLTYERLLDITGLSKAKISGGIKVLRALGLVSVETSGRVNIYKVANFGQKGGWAKLPSKGLYSKDLQRIPVFHEYKLRSKVELNALKIYFLILSFRSNDTNYAVISYERMTTYTGIVRNDIRPAVSLLVAQGLIHVDQKSTAHNDFSTSNMYRPCYVEPYRHLGTAGRAMVGT
ncbi:hypothetical protein [Marinobacter sediminicola]|uniref:hypothetical protein n=1 Tax=Marinobacter sediminicola TaxID=3072994 RepID=UPI00281184D3|nr:hypothetical protein [Marinobacter sp. F26243]